MLSDCCLSKKKKDLTGIWISYEVWKTEGQVAQTDQFIAGKGSVWLRFCSQALSLGFNLLSI